MAWWLASNLQVTPLHTIDATCRVDHILAASLHEAKIKSHKLQVVRPLIVAVDTGRVEHLLSSLTMADVPRPPALQGREGGFGTTIVPPPCLESLFSTHTFLSQAP